MIRKYTVYWIFIGFLFSLQSIAQQHIEGKVYDSETKVALAFANITTNTPATTVSDIDGKFDLHSEKAITTIQCSYVGYESKKITVVSGQKVIIALVRNSNALDEVVISPADNPAHRIIRNATKNKENNNPENKASFQYTSYNKTIYDIQSTEDEAKVKLKKVFQDNFLFIQESVTERKYIRKDISEEVVIATRMSGFKNPSFATLATDMQPFSFYQDNIRLFDLYYLNPISKGSIDKYKFKLEEEILQGNDTLFVISFKPLPRKNFDGLKGMLYINSNQYAIQNVIAEPYEATKIAIKIQQQYSLVDNRYWFPEQLNYTLSMPVFPSTTTKIVMNGKSYIDKVAINIPLEKKDFSLESVRMDENATKRDSLFWDSYRIEKLVDKEKSTYRVIDSIGTENKFDYYLKIAEKLFQSKFPLKYVDIDLSKTIVQNKYEGLRLGTGIYTNEDVFRDFTLGGFVGYGLKDYKWKYGGEVSYHPISKNEFTIGTKYQHNLVEAGFYGLKSIGNLLSIRSFLGMNFDEVDEFSFNVGFRTFKAAKWKIEFLQAKVLPRYEYLFQTNTTRYPSGYYNSELSVNLRFAFKERIVNSFHQNLSLATEYPILSFRYSRGIKGLFESDFNYNKFEAVLEQSFFTKNFGNTKYRLEGGYIDSSLPYGLLFTGEGGYEKGFPYMSKNSFQTMSPNEFLSDTYANLFLSHNFGTLLFKAPSFQPGISLHNNIGWGTISERGNHQLIPFKVKDKIYLETGLQLDNIIKVNYLNVGYFGLGAAAFYRYGYYANPEFKDNIALRMTVNFTLK